MRIDGAVQHQPLPDGQVGVRIKQLLLINIAGAKNDLVRVVWKDMCKSEAVDCSVQNCASIFVAVRRQIGAAAGQAQPQWSTRPNVEDWLTVCLSEDAQAVLNAALACVSARADERKI